MKNLNDTDFFKSIKFEEDPDKVILLKIQEELERIGINKENVLKLTKDLTDVQKQKLEEIYIEQIKEHEVQINNYKKKIVNIRKKLA